MAPGVHLKSPDGKYLEDQGTQAQQTDIDDNEVDGLAAILPHEASADPLPDSVNPKKFREAGYRLVSGFPLFLLLVRIDSHAFVVQR